MCESLLEFAQSANMIHASRWGILEGGCAGICVCECVCVCGVVCGVYAKLSCYSSLRFVVAMQARAAHYRYGSHKQKPPCPYKAYRMRAINIYS